MNNETAKLMPEAEPALPPYRLETLLVCILFFKRVRECARQLLRREHLNRPGEEHLGLLLDVAYEIGAEYPDREKLPYRVVVDRVSDHSRQDACTLTHDVVDRLLPTRDDCVPGDGQASGLLRRAFEETRPDEI